MNSLDGQTSGSVNQNRRHSVCDRRPLQVAFHDVVSVLRVHILLLDHNVKWAICCGSHLEFRRRPHSVPLELSVSRHGCCPLQALQEKGHSMSR